MKGKTMIGLLAVGTAVYALSKMQNQGISGYHNKRMKTMYGHHPMKGAHAGYHAPSGYHHGYHANTGYHMGQIDGFAGVY